MGKGKDMITESFNCFISNDELSLKNDESMAMSVNQSTFLTVNDILLCSKISEKGKIMTVIRQHFALSVQFQRYSHFLSQCACMLTLESF